MTRSDQHLRKSWKGGLLKRKEIQQPFKSGFGMKVVLAYG
jgi:hypothetical protein